MQMRTASIILLLGSGVLASQALTAAAAESPVSTGSGEKYQHELEKSRFDLGDGVHRETDALFERAVGVKGVFLVDKVTGASLAIRNSSLCLSRRSVRRAPATPLNFLRINSRLLRIPTSIVLQCGPIC
jgi:hypothetical protein